MTAQKDRTTANTESMGTRTLTPSGRLPTSVVPSLGDHARAARSRSTAAVDRALLEEQARAGAR